MHNFSGAYPGGNSLWEEKKRATKWINSQLSQKGFRNEAVLKMDFTLNFSASFQRFLGKLTQVTRDVNRGSFRNISWILKMLTLVISKLDLILILFLLSNCWGCKQRLLWYSSIHLINSHWFSLTLITHDPSLNQRIWGFMRNRPKTR